MRSCRVNSDHPADGCDVGIRRIRSEIAAVFFQLCVQGCSSHPRLHSNGVARDADQLIHVARKIDHDAASQTSSRQPGPRTSRHKRNSVVRSIGCQNGDIRRVLWKRNRSRLDFVQTGVSRVQSSRNVICPNFALQRIGHFFSNLSAKFVQLSKLCCEISTSSVRMLLGRQFCKHRKRRRNSTCEQQVTAAINYRFDFSASSCRFFI